MKRIVSLFLLLALAFSLFSCGDPLPASNEPAETKSAQTAEPVKHPEVVDKLTWEKINAFPVANSSMSTSELRKLCVDFFRFAQTFAWTPAEQFTYTIDSSGRDVVLYTDKVYGGLPYVSVASGNIYRLMDWYDPETGVVDMTEAKKAPALFGSQCSIGAYWSWSRVVNSVPYSWTQYMVEKNGFQRVGPYTYREGLETLENPSYNTPVIVEENGQQTMYQSYARLLPADGMVQYTTAGHVVMISSEPHVEYKEDGTIDGDKSYVTFIDQSAQYADATQSDGSHYSLQSKVDAKRSFKIIYDAAYLPFSLPEFDGRDQVEPSVTTFSFEGDEISVEELKEGTVTSNYGISDVYILVKDAEDKEVYRRVTRAPYADVKEVPFSNVVYATSFGKYEGKDNTVEIQARISTGELATVYTGKLVKK